MEPELGLNERKNMIICRKPLQVETLDTVSMLTFDYVSLIKL